MAARHLRGFLIFYATAIKDVACEDEDASKDLPPGRAEREAQKEGRMDFDE